MKMAKEVEKIKKSKQKKVALLFTVLAVWSGMTIFFSSQRTKPHHSEPDAPGYSAFSATAQLPHTVKVSRPGFALCGKKRSKLLQDIRSPTFGAKETFPPKGDDKSYKMFGIGFKKTGATSLHHVCEHVKKHKAGENSMTGRVQALNSIVSRNDTSLALELADRGQHFQDAPWCNEPQRLHRTLATRHPKAKFALTVRDPDQWHASVTRATACRPGKRQKRFCGDVKLSKHAKIFNAKSTSREDMIAAFESHNSAIRDHFYQELKQPSRLLEMDFADPKWKDSADWSLFCSFVGLTVDQCPTGDIPHSNKTPATM
jgi:hypothetical protein